MEGWPQQGGRGRRLVVVFVCLEGGRAFGEVVDSTAEVSLSQSDDLQLCLPLCLPSLPFSSPVYSVAFVGECVTRFCASCSDLIKQSWSPHLFTPLSLIRLLR